MKTLEEVNENEKKQNTAFQVWLGSMQIRPQHQRDLIEYVVGLNRDIADLQADQLRSKSK